MQTQTARKLDESAAGPGLEPETILPSQFFDRVQIDASLQPEKRLMLAVLEDAVDCYQKYAHARDLRDNSEIRLFSVRTFLDFDGCYYADERREMVAA